MIVASRVRNLGEMGERRRARITLGHRTASTRPTRTRISTAAGK